MKAGVKPFSMAFAAGCFGALCNSLFLWFLGQGGMTEALGVRIAPALTPEWIYPRIVWGGLWGFLFLIEAGRGSWFKKGLIYSLLPTLAQLFIVFPFKAHKGMGGLELGLLTPFLVVMVNAVWGLAAAWWYRGTWKKG